MATSAVQPDAKALGRFLDGPHAEVRDEAREWLSREGNAKLAAPVIDRGTEEHPENLPLLKLRWLVHLAMNDWPGAVKAGERMLEKDASKRASLDQVRVMLRSHVAPLMMTAGGLMGMGRMTGEMGRPSGVLTPMPCIPVTTAPWVPGVPTVLVGNMPALDMNAKLICAYGGVNAIKNPPTVTNSTFLYSSNFTTPAGATQATLLYDYPVNSGKQTISITTSL